MREFFESGFSAAVWQMISGVLSFVFLAYLLHLVGSQLKAEMALLFGKVHRIIVIPGEFFKNVGVSIACLLTGVRMRRHVIANDASGSTTSITHSRLPAGTPSGFVRNLVILTAPIWFGSLVLTLIALVAGGAGMLPDVKSVFANGDPGAFAYAAAVATEAVSMLCSLVCVWHWTSPFCLFCILCFISIATEITIDSRSIWAIKTGLFGLFVLLILLNAIPGVSTVIATVGTGIRPVVFTLHVILSFVVLFDLVAFCLFRVLAKVFRRRKRAK